MSRSQPNRVDRPHRLGKLREFGRNHAVRLAAIAAVLIAYGFVPLPSADDDERRDLASRFALRRVLGVNPNARQVGFANALAASSELGEVVEKHLTEIGLLMAPELDEHRKRLIAEKRAEFEAESRQQDAFAENAYPEGAQLCTKCNTAAVVMMDGCMTCLSCGDSKCG